MTCLVSSPVLLVSQHFLFCNHARAHSGVEHTSAVSTVTVRDPCDQPSSSLRATSSRSPCITGSSCSSSSPGNPLPLCTRSDSRSVQSSFGNTFSGRKHCLLLSRHQRLTPPCSSSHSRDSQCLRSFTLQQYSCRYMTISAGYICDRHLQVQCCL